MSGDVTGTDLSDARDAPDRLLLASLYCLEGAAVTLGMGLNKKGALALLPFLATRPGWLSLMALATCLVSGWVIVRRFRRRRRDSRRFAFTVALNLVSVSVTTAIAETALRALTVQTVAGPMVAGTVLLPRAWDDEAVRQHEVWRRSEHAPPDTRYFVYDDALGWTVGSRRKTPDGLYASSAEGIRSADPRVVYAGRQPHHRIAIVGDSYTFGLEVSYADSWGRRLEQDLGPDVEILNFGVDGYGIDQTYLRYLRDVRPWHPDVVVFGVVNHDTERTMSVYPFISFPGWTFPFAKPRFSVTTDGPRLLNLPLPSPDVVFARRSVADLPYIEFDRGYDRAEWEWHWYHHSFLSRYLLSRWPRWPVRGPVVSDDAKRSLNHAMLRSVMRETAEAGSSLIIVYFPARAELLPADQRPGDWRFARDLLDAERIPYIDLTACVAEVPHDVRWAKLHYSPRTNTAVARCLREPVFDRLSDIRSRAR
jgi:hypothetical protein